MSDVRMLDAIEFIDTDIIEEADTFIGRKKKKLVIMWETIAACLCLATVVVSLTHISKKDDIKDTNTGIAAVEGMSENAKGATSDYSTTEQTGISSADANVGVYIEPIEMPGYEDGVIYDMIGMVVYQGRIYTQSYSYYGSEAKRVEGLLGAYLGYATGSIDEWATQDDLAVEFASSIEGEVYEVVGYDTSFRVCVRWESEGENGEKVLQLQFLDCLNGITLTNGADLFETRLHLRNHVVSKQWQSHYDWNYDIKNIQNASIGDEVWEEFLDQLDAGVVVNTWDADMYTDPTSMKTSIYDTEKQAHIILTMDDGTVIQLRMIDGGYVGYDGLSWYFVYMPGEIFDAIFDAMGGNS